MGGEVAIKTPGITVRHVSSSPPPTPLFPGPFQKKLHHFLVGLFISLSGLHVRDVIIKRDQNAGSKFVGDRHAYSLPFLAFIEASCTPLSVCHCLETGARCPATTVSYRRPGVGDVLRLFFQYTD